MIDIKFTYNLPIHIENKKYETALFFGHLNGIFGNTDSDGRFTVFQDPYDVLVTLVSGNTKIWFVVCTEEEKLYVNGILKSTLFQKLVERRIKVNIQKTYPYILDIIIDTKSLIKNNVRITVTNDNDKAFKEINKRKFDVCLMNPPYGDGQNKGLHYEFVEKVLNICSETYCVMPFGLINKYSSTDVKYKPVLGPHTVYAEEINGDIFPGTTQHNVGIYKFTANVNDNIHIKYIDGRTCNVSMLTNNPIDMSDSTVKHIVNILSSNGNYTHYMRFCGKFSNVNSECKKAGITDQSVIDKMIYDKIADNCTRQLPLNKKYLMVNMANGAMNAHYISADNIRIFTSVQDVIETLYSLKKSTGFNFMVFNSELELNNCIIALENPMLRMVLSIVQYDQNMTITNCYKYIPNIDWSDPRVVTDEGLLEVCGCPKDKCKEYAEYCRKYITNIDN